LDVYLRNGLYRWEKSDCGSLTLSFSLAAPNLDAESNASPTGEHLRAFLAESLSRDHQTPEFRFQLIDLNGDGQDEAIVYVNDRRYCGSGGCLLLVLKRGGTSFKIVGRTTITWPPIKVLEHQTHGWRDIAVQVHGGGIAPGYEAVLSFDGDHYPINPAVSPALRAPAPVAGQVLSDLGK
jgi:hypothetical protein